MATRAQTEGGSCPQCSKPTLTEFRPFCSRRCANLDLGKWFGEEYRVPSVEPPADFEQLLEDAENEL